MSRELTNEELLNFIIKQPKDAESLLKMPTDMLKQMQYECIAGIEYLQKIMAADYEQIKPIAPILPLLKRWRVNRKRLDELRDRLNVCSEIVDLETGTLCSLNVEDLGLDTDDEMIPLKPFEGLGDAVSPNAPNAPPSTPRRGSVVRSKTPNPTPSKLPRMRYGKN